MTHWKVRPAVVVALAAITMGPVAVACGRRRRRRQGNQHDNHDNDNHDDTSTTAPAATTTVTTVSSGASGDPEPARGPEPARDS